MLVLRSFLSFSAAAAAELGCSAGKAEVMRRSRPRLLILSFALLALAAAVAPSPEAGTGCVLEAQAVLEQVLTDVLNNPELQTSRDWYGTPGDRRLVLLI